MKRPHPEDPVERWEVDAGAADIATLELPPSALRLRRFEIDVRFVVSAAPGAEAPWHALAVELDGQRVWSRRIDTHHGATDSLDFHCRRELAAGQALRVRAISQVGGARRVRLLIEAEEQSAP